jgi:hypothetical protein
MELAQIIIIFAGRTEFKIIWARNVHDVSHFPGYCYGVPESVWELRV